MYRLLRNSALAACLLLAPLTARALGTFGPGTYALLDHGDGQLGTAYGLRLDGIGEVFSVEIGSAELSLTWDGGTTATLSGALNANSSGGSGGVGDTWMVSYTLTDVSAVGTAGFEATAGSGTLTDPLSNVTALTGKQDESGIAFTCLADGHRIGGDSDSPVCRGWLMDTGTNDWLLRTDLEPIPEPGTGLLALLGLAGIAARRR